MKCALCGKRHFSGVLYDHMAYYWTELKPNGICIDEAKIRNLNVKQNKKVSRQTPRIRKGRSK